MLPRPSGSLLSASRKTGISLALSGNSGQPGSISLHDRLSSRSRVTNLGIVLLLGFASLSALLNLRYMIFGAHGSGQAPPPPGFASWATFHGYTPDSLKEVVPAPRNGTSNLNHLVLVPGHAVWAGCDVRQRDNDENWILEDYQRGGSVKTFFKHIEKGVQIANSDPQALVVFSGGQTRPSSLQTEAESYFSLAVAADLELPVIAGSLLESDLNGGKSSPASSSTSNSGVQGSKTTVGSLAHANAAVATRHGLQDVRMTTENFALDSFENLLFSIARFREYTGFYPERITVVGYGFKKDRFEQLHAKAVRWPTKAYVGGGGGPTFQYVGIDDEGDDIELQYKGEKVKAFSLFDKDMYGCHNALKAKRIQRNPTRRFHPYFSSAPEIADLLNWCPADMSGLQGIYPHNLPWDLRVTGSGWGRGALAVKASGKKGFLPDSRWLQIGREGH
ncbi:uncharacterized protein PFL1_06489 [Pseudozyma flocculosa PF-1]|uniref:Uncharacterized protein n=2 Tax=Pseudozyma flocculosa TaxID=84751 RepID=A0A5C3EVV3_9BASI|nr:uncharacterized protein PFL1_06489 [Pseudozyma flocculosa PF-1]EPQ26036.1 hypothetical protein PFL1_06489 [Pseudozyma flocculosa PF-1]SPO35656.1 uncharacterized protein PSFLO_01127 [Pseudozyma flocculosa]